MYAIFLVYRQEISCHWTTNVLFFAVTGKILNSFLLLPSLAAASFRAIVRAVFIEGYLNVGLGKLSIVGEAEAQVLDGYAALAAKKAKFAR